MKQTRPGRGAEQYPLRLPEGMRDHLKAEAEHNGRSLNAEIVHRLELSLAGADGGGDAIDQIFIHSMSRLLDQNPPPRPLSLKMITAHYESYKADKLRKLRELLDLVDDIRRENAGEIEELPARYAQEQRREISAIRGWARSIGLDLVEVRDGRLIPIADSDS